MPAEMNSVERVRLTIAGETPDRVPVLPLMVHHPIKIAGFRLDECAHSPRLLAAAHVRAWETYGYDGCHITCDNWILPSALGCPIRFAPNQPPASTVHILANCKDLNLLTQPKTGIEGRMGFKVEATRLAAAAIGDRCFLKTCFDQGPFSLASAVRGIEAVMMDCIDDPRFVLDLLEICTDAVIKFARACGQAGCHALTFGDSTASLLSRRLYEQFAFPYEKRVIDSLADLGIPVFLHICGDTSHIIDLMAATGAAGLEVDYQHSIAFYKNETRDRVCLQGNIDPVGVMLRGTPEQVRNACRDAMQQGKQGRPFILSGGCEIPRDTPAENLRAMLAAAQEFGRYDN